MARDQKDLIHLAWTEDGKVRVSHCMSKEGMDELDRAQIKELAAKLGRTVAIEPLTEREYRHRIGIPDGVSDLFRLPDGYVLPDRVHRDRWKIVGKQIVVEPEPEPEPEAPAA